MTKPTLTIELNDELQQWAATQANPAAAAAQILLANIGAVRTPFDEAKEKFRENLANVPAGFDFEIPQVIGSETWEKLERGDKLTMGKFIRANTEAFGIVYIRTTKSRHTVYQRRPSA